MPILFDIGLQKKELRSVMLARRRSASAEALEELSILAQQNLMRQERWLGARSVALYVATKNEVSTQLLLESAAASGKVIFLPRVCEKSQGLMEFAVCAGEHELQTGAYDIREPDPGLCPSCFFSAPEDCPADALEVLPPYSWGGAGGVIAPAGVPVQTVGKTEKTAGLNIERQGIVPPPDLFVIPGVAFDRKGRRLGFGGGFYDRFLANPLLREHSFFVGLAYGFQLLDEVPGESWDQPVDAICTDLEYSAVHLGPRRTREDNNG